MGLYKVMVFEGIIFLYVYNLTFIRAFVKGGIESSRYYILSLRIMFSNAEKCYAMRGRYRALWRYMIQGLIFRTFKFKFQNLFLGNKGGNLA